MDILEWNKSSMYSNQPINQSIIRKSHMLGPPTKTRLFFSELISQIL